MAELDLQFIGTGNAFAPGGLCWNGFVADGRFLFEAPPQALQSLNAMRIDPNALEAVILSHHHGDHFLGLPFLLLEWKYSGRDRPIRIVGPPGTRELTTDISLKVYPGIFDTDFEVEWETLAEGSEVRVGGLELQARAVKHDERLSGTFGFAATLAGRRFAYTGDTAMCDAVLDLARETEVLISECASRADEIDIHMNLVTDIPKVRAAMNDESTLILTHLGPGVDDGGLPNTIVAQDLARYRL